MDQPFDEARSEAFAGQMIGVLNDASLALMASIGHQTGLFDAMADAPAATSEQIAGAAGLQERYVREWLGAMVTGKVVDYEPETGAYSLPAEHAAWLTRSAGPNNLAAQTQYIPLLAQIEAPLIDCFRNGGGVPYAAYPQFQRLMAEDSGAVHDAALIDTILPLVAGLTERLESGIDVLDAGCGSGHAINLMARAFPKSRFTGYDFSDEGVRRGREEADRLGLSNARFEVQDVATLDAVERFDLITAFDAIHDQADPARVLSNISTALRPDGVFLMVDIGASSDVHENKELMFGPFMYTISCMHCMTVSLALDGAGLGAMWGKEKALEMLADAGFTNVEIKQAAEDVINSYYIARK
jgi:SAM-dependent methyltransferase